MRILITGGKGQLGRALTVVLKDDDLLAPGHDELDITEASSVRAALRDAEPEVIIHAAAWTDTAGCEREPARALAVNAGGTRAVAEACREAGVQLLYVSTNEVFDGEKGAPYEEGDASNALNEYGRSKLAGEAAVRETLPEHYIVRTSWLYGPGRVSYPEKIVQAALERGVLKLVTDEIASPTWTLDLAGAISRLIRTASFGVYHLANSGRCSRKEWAEEILRLAGLDIPVEPSTQAEFGAPFSKPVDSTLANVKAASLGITMRPWRAALADHMRHPEAGVRRLLAKAEVKR